VKVLDRSPRLVRFEGFQLDLRAGELRPDAGKSLRLSEQPFRILTMLLERPGEVLTREEIRKELWPDNTIVEFEHSINAAMNRLRQALGDSGDHPRYIETLARRGYRWMVSVEGMEVGPTSDVAPRHPWRWLPLAVALLLGIGLTAGVLRFVLSSPKSSAPALTSVPLTALPGHEYEPSFSPDGSQVVFTRSEEGDESKSHIYVKLIGTSGPPLQLTNGPAGDFNPVWSPDGRFIAFLREFSDRYAVLLIPALGGPERKIAETRLAHVPGPYLAWSPDGNSLVISHKDKDSPKEPAALFVVAIDTGEKRRLTSPPSAVSDSSGDTNPAFSPDGRTLAFIRMSDFRTELYLLPVSDALQSVGEAKRIPLGQSRYAPAWTEDGREIIFWSWRQGLWRIGVSGSDTRSAEPARLPFGDNALCPAISRRGHRLAYSNGIFRNSSIWRMAVPSGPSGPSARDGTRVGSFNRSFISSTQNDLHPQFSPDGKRIAFVSERSGNFEIWVCNSDGSSPVQLTSFHGPVVTTPRWSPDGRRIAFDSSAGGGEFDIWVIGVDGGKPVRMTTHPANDGNPSWSRDGRWIYFDSKRTGEQQVWKMPADGGEAIQVTRDGGYAPLESPDGKFLYYTKYLWPTSLWRVPLGGGRAAKVLEGLSSYINLAIVDKGIYFVHQDAASGCSIEFLDLQTNQIRRVASFERPVDMGYFGGGLVISPDGRWILYTRADQGGAELRLVENFH
jgi:Tol biopolymer transport system component/DNA-binding winged helix-turn-helix (wHTH) protein